MSNEVSKFEKELNLILSKKFFFKEQDKNKLIIYSIIYLALTYVGAMLDLWLISSIFTVFYLCYVLGAGGIKYFVPIGVIGSLGAYILGDLYALFWTGISALLSLIIYFSIINRYSKIFIVIYTTVFLFFSVAIFTIIILKTGYIKYNPEHIQTFIDNYVNWMVNAQPALETDKNLLIQSFEEIKITLPVMLFSYLFLYSLLLVQNTMVQLSREKVIIPVFPRLSKVTLNSKFAWIYLLGTFIFFIIVSSTGYSRYDISSLLVENFIGIIRWAFVFNGLFTIYFFLEEKKKGNILLKVLIFIAMYLLSFIFEMIGLIDSLFKLREYYLRSKGGK